MAYPDQNKLNYMATRPIPTMPQMPTKESPWAKRRRAQLMTRMEDQGPAMLGPQFLQYQHSPMSGQRAAAIASRDLGTDYQQELPNFTAQDATDYAMQNAAPDFIKSRLATEEVGRDLPYKQLEQQGSQFTQGLESNKYGIDKNYQVASERLASDNSLSMQEKAMRQKEIEYKHETDLAAIGYAREQAVYQQKLDFAGKVTDPNLDPAAAQFIYDYAKPQQSPSWLPQSQGSPAPQQQTFNAPGMGGQTMTPQADQMTNQPGYPSFLGGSGRPNQGRIVRQMQTADAVLAKYGLNNYTSPVEGGPKPLDSIRSDKFNPNESTMIQLQNLNTSIDAALADAQGDPDLQLIIKQRLAQSILPEISKFKDRPGMFTMNPFGRTKLTDWLTGGHGAPASDMIQQITRKLTGM
jgi:hypothetical protein